MKFSLDRARVLSSIKQKPKTITDLAKELKKYGSGFSRANLYTFIQELKDKGLVAEMLATKKKGKRVPKLLYATEDADPIKKKYWDIFDMILKTEGK